MTATPLTQTEATADERAVQAAVAAAAVLPSEVPLNASGVQPGIDGMLSMFAAAAVARLTGRADSLAVLVADDLVQALRSSPIPGLELAAAVQPAIDAAAAALGYAAEPAREVELALVASELGAGAVAVPLIGAGFAACVLASPGALAPSDPAPEVPASFAPDPSLPTPQPAAAAYPASYAPAGTGPRRGIEMLHGVDMELTVELGRTRMTVRELLALSPGDVLELDRTAGSPADLLVNGRLIARGEVVVVDEDFGLRVTEIVDSAAS
jgi:flagellar motor switch protein FliN/FliY